MVLEDSTVWAAGNGAMLFWFGIAEVEVISGHDSEVELEGAGAAFCSVVCVEGAPLLAIEAEDWTDALTIELVAPDVEV